MISVASAVFFKEQPVLEFLKDVLFGDLQGGGGGRGGRGGGGGGRGGRGGGGGGRGDRGGGGGGRGGRGRRGEGRGGRGNWGDGGGRGGGGGGANVEIPRSLDERQRRKFLKEIKGKPNGENMYVYVHTCVYTLDFAGLKIVVTHLSYPRHYRVNDVTATTASQQTYVINCMWLTVLTGVAILTLICIVLLSLQVSSDTREWGSG